MAELRDHSSRHDVQDRPLRRFPVALARGLDIVIYEAWLEAVDFGDALDRLNNLDFVELILVQLDPAERERERRAAVATQGIAGVLDPDWLDMPQRGRERSL